MNRTFMNRSENFTSKHVDYDAAQRELEQTLAADPSRTHALYLLGRVFVKRRTTKRHCPI